MRCIFSVTLKKTKGGKEGIRVDEKYEDWKHQTNRKTKTNKQTTVEKLWRACIFMPRKDRGLGKLRKKEE